MNEADLQETLLALELELLAPAVRASGARSGALLADEFVEFGSSGRIYDKPAIIASLAQSDTTEEFQVRDFRLVAADEHQALAAYTCEARANTGELLRTSNRSSFWVLRAGCWQLLFHQGTRSA